MVELHSCKASIKLMTWRHTISTIWQNKTSNIKLLAYTVNMIDDADPNFCRYFTKPC